MKKLIKISVLLVTVVIIFMIVCYASILNKKEEVASIVMKYYSNMYIEQCTVERNRYIPFKNEFYISVKMASGETFDVIVYGNNIGKKDVPIFKKLDGVIDD